MNMNKIGNRTYLALKYLYLNSVDIQNRTEATSHPFYKLAHVKEFCTIKIATARQSGHTNAIVKFVNENNKKKWAVILHRRHQFQNFHKLLKTHAKTKIVKESDSYIEFEKGKVHLMTDDNFERDLRGLELDGIIVDCAFFLSQSKIEQLYKIGMPCMINRFQQFFIFVQ